MAKKKYKVYVDLLVTVEVDENADPNGIDSTEFDTEVANSIRHRMEEEGLSFISESITNWEEDEVSQPRILGSYEEN
jgi:hypothetical protein